MDEAHFWLRGLVTDFLFAFCGQLTKTGLTCNGEDVC